MAGWRNRACATVGVAETSSVRSQDDFRRTITRPSKSPAPSFGIWKPARVPRSLPARRRWRHLVAAARGTERATPRHRARASRLRAFADPDWMMSVSDLAYFYLDVLRGAGFARRASRRPLRRRLDRGRDGDPQHRAARDADTDGAGRRRAARRRFGDIFLWSAEEFAAHQFHDRQARRGMAAARPGLDIDIDLQNRAAAGAARLAPAAAQSATGALAAPHRYADLADLGRGRPGHARSPATEPFMRGIARAPASGVAEHRPRAADRTRRRDRGRSSTPSCREPGMKTFFFHLMPYADLDLNYADRYNSAWVTLPNSYFDPDDGRAALPPLHRRARTRRRARLRRHLRQRAPPERLWPDAGAEPDRRARWRAPPSTPRSRSSAARCRWSSNPVNIAEEFAMLDQMSGGRIIAGFVRGIGSEYYRQRRQSDALARALLRGARSDPAAPGREIGPFRYHGRHYQFDYVNLWPRPLQQPHPPVWIPSQGSSETVRVVRGGETQIHLSADLQPDRSSRRSRSTSIARSPRSEGYEAHRRRSAGRCRSTWRRPTRSRAASSSRTSRRSSTNSCAMPHRDAVAARLFVDRLDQGADREQVRAARQRA